MKLRFLIALCISLFGLSATAAVQSYSGGFYGTSGDTAIVSGGTLQLSGSVGSSINFTFTRGGTDSGTMNNYLVLFLDSTTGGYASTANFTARGDYGVSAISGLNPTTSARSYAYFASGFTADYAVIINPNIGAQLWQLSTGDFTQLQQYGVGVDGNTRSYSFYVSRADLGMGSADELRFQSSYVTGTGYRTLESFELLTGTVGFNSVNFQNYNIFDVQPVPEMTNVAVPIFAGLLISVGGVRRVRQFLRNKQSLA